MSRDHRLPAPIASSCESCTPPASLDYLARCPFGRVCFPLTPLFNDSHLRWPRVLACTRHDEVFSGLVRAIAGTSLVQI